MKPIDINTSNTPAIIQNEETQDVPVEESGASSHAPLELVSEKLASLRAAMAAEGIDAMIVANSDPHNNEYAAERWRSRQWLTHMKGSNGTVVVTADWCGLWTDSRYYEVATNAIEGTETELMRMSDVGVLTIEEWLISNLNNGQVVGFNGSETNLAQLNTWKERLETAGLKLCGELDLVGPVWLDRPAAPKGELFLVDDVYTGKRIETKIAEVREKMKAQKLNAYLLGRTDESCWLLNFRGTDIRSNPTPYCYTILTHDDVKFFIDPDKLTRSATEKFQTAGVTLMDYDDVESELKKLDRSVRLLLVPQYTNCILAKASEHCAQVTTRSIITDLKGVKNATEVAHLKRALIDDGAALVKFFTWLDCAMRLGETITEYDASCKLDELRGLVDGYRHVSFDSIVGFDSNGALNHYAAEQATAKKLKPESLLLIDSGGNYVHGTTDTTRTIPLGEPTQQQKDDYTVVLCGMLDLLTLDFPEGATGAQLDGVCRQAQWRRGRHFKHGTGHGVGFGLEVHEGPQNISGVSHEKMELGMITTIEPGCYRSGEYGIRIENMVHTELAEENEFGRFFKFENLTFCPINTDLIEPTLLPRGHIDWINAYHAEVIEKLSPLLNDDERRWLEHECRPLATG